MGTIEYEMSLVALGSFPKTLEGYIDLFELYRTCAKFDIDFDMVEDEEPYKLLLEIEGKLEMQREYFEFLNYSLYNAIGQLFSKGKGFKNPFEKKEEKQKQKPTKEIKERTMDVLDNIFKISEEEKQ